MQYCAPMQKSDLHVLHVDDDEIACQLLGSFFASRGVRFTAVHSAENLDSAIENLRPSIVVLDLMLPRVDGLTALRRLREHDKNTPVIMLTALADETERIIGLEMGADDYVGKPFLPRELLARIHAVLRFGGAQSTRPAGPALDRIQFGRFELTLSRQTLLKDGAPVKIGESEILILGHLASRPMQVISREALVRLLESRSGSSCTRSIYVAILRLRRIVEVNPEQPRVIQTVRTRGYMFVPETDAGDSEIE